MMATDAEKALLGACIIDGALIEAVSHLDPSDFYFQSHQRVFEALLDLSQLAEPIDLITVENRLREKGQEVSAAEVAGMAEGAFASLVYVQQYAQIITKEAKKRRVLALLKEAEAQITSGDYQDFLADAIATLTAFHSTGNGKQTRGEPVLVRVCDVKREEVAWLWDDRVPLGKLTLFEGDPGVGKSFCSLAIAAAITRGLGLPGQKHNDPGSVLILSCEDGIGDTIRPRLEDMGADLSKVCILRGAKDRKGQEHTVSLSDLDILEHAIGIEKPSLCVVDPLIAYLGRGIDEWKASSVRSVLGPLAGLAEKTGSAVVGIRHLVKSTARAVYKGAGSIDFLAACRSAFVFGENPDTPGEFVMAHVKSSLAPKAASLSYSIIQGRFLWGGESPIMAERLVVTPATGDEATEKGEAEAFLREILSEGPLASSEVKKQAREVGVSERTLWRAKTSIRVKANKDGRGGWSWLLPS